MQRDELILRTRQLIAEGERLDADPSLGSLQTWLQRSDDLLATAWGTMDRYHLAWLMVGKPKGLVRGRVMTADEEAAYVREVASQKTAALRMSLDAVERQGMPFRGETGGVGAGQGMGQVPDGATATAPGGEPSPRRVIPLGPELQHRLDEVRRAAADHAAADHADHRDHGVGAEPISPAQRRAPRPGKLQHCQPADGRAPWVAPRQRACSPARRPAMTTSRRAAGPYRSPM